MKYRLNGGRYRSDLLGFVVQIFVTLYLFAESSFRHVHLLKYQSYENAQGIENFLKFSNFSKIFKKGAWRTHNTPKPSNKDVLFLKKLRFLKSSFAGLGVLWVRQALFLKIFEKFENFRRLSIPWAFSYD